MGSSISSHDLRLLSHSYKIKRDLLEHLINLLGLEETKNILQIEPVNLIKTARVNFLKITRKECLELLLDEKIVAEVLPDVPEGIIITKGWKKLGSSQAYLAGNLIPQGLGSIMAVHSLDPQPGEVILDLAAAPGGKSSFIGERLQNQGFLIANEISKNRSVSLIHNLMRHGIQNALVTLADASSFFTNQHIDRILLDAPCSGDGLIISNKKRRKSKSLLNSFAMQRIQISILSNALTLLDSGGICLYSTCALNTIENEDVLLQLKDQFFVERINIPGNPGINEKHSEFSYTRRLLPSTHSCDGFFIAKLRKR